MKDINQTNMPFFDMENANDLYKKLIHDFKLLNIEKPNIYNYMNFIFTANHLKEWIEKDINFDPSKKLKSNEIFSHKKNKEYNTINSLCNKSKHFYLDKEEYEKEKIKISGFDFNEVDFSSFTFEGLNYFVEVNKKKVKLYDLCKKIFNDYEIVFKT